MGKNHAQAGGSEYRNTFILFITALGVFSCTFLWGNNNVLPPGENMDPSAYREPTQSTSGTDSGTYNGWGWEIIGLFLVFMDYYGYIIFATSAVIMLLGMSLSLMCMQDHIRFQENKTERAVRTRRTQTRTVASNDQGEKNSSTSTFTSATGRSTGGLEGLEGLGRLELTRSLRSDPDDPIDRMIDENVCRCRNCSQLLTDRDRSWKNFWGSEGRCNNCTFSFAILGMVSMVLKALFIDTLETSEMYMKHVAMYKDYTQMRWDIVPNPTLFWGRVLRYIVRNDIPIMMWILFNEMGKKLKEIVSWGRIRRRIIARSNV